MPPDPVPSRSERVDELMEWLCDPAQDEMFARIEDQHALEHGRVTERMVERGARALDHGLYAQFDEAYKRQAAAAVLRAAIGRDA